LQDKIMPNRLDRGFQKYQEEIEEAALKVLRSGWYVLGPEVEQFEKEFAEYTGAKYCVHCLLAITSRFHMQTKSTFSGWKIWRILLRSIWR